MHESSMDKMRLFREKHLQGKKETPLNILDLGSLDVVGNYTYKEIFNCPNWTYTGVDMAEGDNVDIVLRNPYAWREIKSNSVDVFVSGQAFEHVEYIWILMLEVFRVLKPGGICCIIAPAGGFEHRYPVDCWRFYPDGLNALAKFSGMTTVEAYTQWEPEGYSRDNSDVWQDSVLICRKQEPSIKQRFINRIQFSALTIGLNRIIADNDPFPGGVEHFDLQNIDNFTKAREIRNKLQSNDLPSLADFETLLEAYEGTKQAYEDTRQAYEDLKQAKEPTWSSIKDHLYNRLKLNDLPSQEDYEKLLKAYKDTKAAYKQTRQAYEDTKQAYEDTRQAYEDIKQSD